MPPEMTAESAYLHAKDVIKGRYIEGESIIFKSPTFSCRYSINVLGCRTPYIDNIVLSDLRFYPCLNYLDKWFRHGWVEIEPLLKWDSQYTQRYTQIYRKSRWAFSEQYFDLDEVEMDWVVDVLGCRYPKIELSILHPTSALALEYTRYVVKARWVEAEHIILLSAWSSYRYMQDAVKGRWFEAEHIISPRMNAQTGIRGRWPIVEKDILLDIQNNIRYFTRNFKYRWIEAEHLILNATDYTFSYTQYPVRGRWFEAEPTIKGRTLFKCLYQNNTLKTVWPMKDDMSFLDQVTLDTLGITDPDLLEVPSM